MTAPPTSDLSAGAARLLERVPGLGVPRPAFEGRSLPNVARTVAAALGHDLSGTLAPLAAEIDPFAGRRAGGPIVVFVVDGLGWPALLRAAREHPESAAARWATAARPITTVFPSSTTVALTSLSTAAAPSQHGIVGHREYLPRFGSVVEILRMAPLGGATDNSLVGPNWSSSSLRGTPTIFERGVRASAVSRDRFEGTGFTRMIYEGASYVPYATFAGLAHELKELLAADAPPSLLLVYWDELDSALHRHGPAAGLTGFEVDRLGALLAWVARGLPNGRARTTTTLITADHGLVAADPGRQLHVDTDPELVGLLARPPSGDRRAAFLSARSGGRSRLGDLLEERMRGYGRRLEVGRAVEAGLFGPPPHHPELVERIGEWLVLPDPPGGVLYDLPGHRPARRPSVGAHGGLDAEEFLVPLLAGTLEELAGPPGRGA